MIAVDSTATFFRTNNIHTGHQTLFKHGEGRGGGGELSSFLDKNLGTLEARDNAITTARRPVELIRAKLKCSGR